MLRQRILISALVLLGGVLAATRFAPGPPGAARAKPQLANPVTASSPVIVWPRAPAAQVEADPVSTMLIPTEIPADSTKLLPGFTPPADVRLLARREPVSRLSRRD
jgi:hypothetical protein